jgi:hypothetical protein
MRSINASRFFGLFLLLFGLIITGMFYLETHSSDRVHVLLFLAVPLFLAMGVGFIVIPPCNKKISDIIGDKSLVELFKIKNLKQAIDFNGSPVWKQVILAVLIIGAVIAGFVLLIQYSS